MKVPFSDRFWHQLIFASSNGKISLMAAERGKGSVQVRIDLFRKLLYQGRIFFSKTNCPSTIEMCKSLKHGTRIGELIARGSPHKHIFDACTYAICSELYDELSTESWDIMRNVRKLKREGRSGSLVTVPL